MGISSRKHLIAATRTLVLSGALLSGSAVSAAAAGHRVHRLAPRKPNLVVKSGSAALSGAILTGSFTVKNTGHKAAPSGAAYVQIAGAGSIVIERYQLAGIAAGGKVVESISAAVPGSVPAGTHSVLACAKLSPAKATAHCATIGSITTAANGGPAAGGPTGTGTTGSTGTGTTGATGTTGPAAGTTGATGPSTGATGATGAPISTVPTNPPANISKNDTPMWFTDGLGQYGGVPNSPGTNPGDPDYFTSGYWVDVPSGYDPTKAERLLVWLHGCFGGAQGDAYELGNDFNPSMPDETDPAYKAVDNQNFIVMAPAGPEDQGKTAGLPVCWNQGNSNVNDPGSDVNKFLTDIAQVETEFNIDPQRIVIGGYSSGGDLAYRTIFTHASMFAGIVAMNTNPFRDTGLTLAQEIGAESWKFPIVHVAHASDTEYHPNACGVAGAPACGAGDDVQSDPGVSPALTTLQADGHTVDYQVLPGTHYDDNNANCRVVRDPILACGTYYDIHSALEPKITADKWVDPYARASTSPAAP